MKKLFTLLSAMLLATGAFAATEQAWYNDVTSITNNGQYYIYSVNGKGFMQGGNSKVKTVTQNNYNSESNLLFTIAGQNGAKTHSGSNYLSSYQYGTNGPIGDESTSGTNIYWTSMNNGQYWNIHGKYNFMGDKYACLQYDGGYSGLANVLGQKETHTDAKSQWYLVSPAQYDRHWAIYLYDRYKESIADYTKWENLVPAAYYTALADAYAVTYSVKNTAHSKEVVNAHRADLKALYDNAEALADAYANAKAAIDALEAVEDKGEDFAEVTAGITAARSAIEEAMSVDALNAAVSAPALKAIDPITFSVTEFTAISSVEGAAASAANRAIAYDAADKTIINAEGQAIYAGTTTLTATAAATEQYYKFVRSAQVTVTAPTTYGDFEEHSCDTPVEFNGQSYDASFAGDIKVGLNYMGGDSVVHVAITVNHATFGTDAMSIVYGDDAEWNGISLKDSTVGVHTVIFVTSNVAGCDSTVTLTLTVNKQATVEMEYPIEFCAEDQQTYRGVVYTEAGSFPLDLIEGTIRDTMITVVVTVHEKILTTEYKEDSVGHVIELPEGEWYLGEELIEGSTYELQEADTAGLEFIHYDATEFGCDSTVKIVVTVLYEAEPEDPGETTAFERVNANSETVKEFRNGTLYIRRGERLFTAEGREVK